MRILKISKYFHLRTLRFRPTRTRAMIIIRLKGATYIVKQAVVFQKRKKFPIENKLEALA